MSSVNDVNRRASRPDKTNVKMRVGDGRENTKARYIEGERKVAFLATIHKRLEAGFKYVFGPNDQKRPNSQKLSRYGTLADPRSTIEAACDPVKRNAQQRGIWPRAERMSPEMSKDIQDKLQEDRRSYQKLAPADKSGSLTDALAENDSASDVDSSADIASRTTDQSKASDDSQPAQISDKDAGEDRYEDHPHTPTPGATNRSSDSPLLPEISVDDPDPDVDGPAVIAPQAKEASADESESHSNDGEPETRAASIRERNAEIRERASLRRKKIANENFNGGLPRDPRAGVKIKSDLKGVLRHREVQAKQKDDEYDEGDNLGADKSNQDDESDRPYAMKRARKLKRELTKVATEAVHSVEKTVTSFVRSTGRELTEAAQATGQRLGLLPYAEQVLRLPPDLVEQLTPAQIKTVSEELDKLDSGDEKSRARLIKLTKPVLRDAGAAADPAAYLRGYVIGRTFGRESDVCTELFKKIEALPGGERALKGCKPPFSPTFKDALDFVEGFLKTYNFVSIDQESKSDPDDQNEKRDPAKYDWYGLTGKEVKRDWIRMTKVIKGAKAAFYPKPTEAKSAEQQLEEVTRAKKEELLKKKSRPGQIVRKKAQKAIDVAQVALSREARELRRLEDAARVYRHPTEWTIATCLGTDRDGYCVVEQRQQLSFLQRIVDDECVPEDRHALELLESIGKSVPAFRIGSYAQGLLDSHAFYNPGRFKESAQVEPLPAEMMRDFRRSGQKGMGPGEWLDVLIYFAALEAKQALPADFRSPSPKAKKDANTWKTLTAKYRMKDLASARSYTLAWETMDRNREEKILPKYRSEPQATDGDDDF